jgi:hypothetical protein
MVAALKAFTRGTLTFFEIIIVVLFIASLAAIAALGSLRTRKRNRTLKIPDLVSDPFNPDPRRNSLAR